MSKAIPYARIYALTKKNARIRGRAFDLTEDQFMEIVARANGRCELSSIEFRATSQYSRNPWAASLDRIECDKGYSLANCRLVCCAANIAMNVWGPDVILELADGIRKRPVLRHQPCFGILSRSQTAHICGPRVTTSHLKKLAVFGAGPRREFRSTTYRIESVLSWLKGIGPTELSSIGFNGKVRPYDESERIAGEICRSR